MDKLPEEEKLDIKKTFESQHKSVNRHIVPMIQKSINKKIFPVDDGIIRHIIHERHRHQREEFLNKTKTANWNDEEKRRKRANTRRSDVSKNRVVYFIFLLINFFLLRNEIAERKQ